MNSKILNFFKLIIGWPIAIIAIAFIFRIIGSKSYEVLPKLKNIDYAMLTYGLLFFIAYFFLRSIAWQKILKNAGFSFPLRDISFLWGVSELKRYAPGNIWSFLSRALFFQQRGVDKKTIAKSLAREMELIIYSSFIVSLFSLNFILSNISLNLDKALIMIVSNLLAVIIAIFFVFRRKGVYLKKVELLVIFCLSVFSFGLGTFFSANAIFYLDPRQIITFSSFFVFALLAGYLSIITPMGLGVREGVMTLGMSSVITLQAAGLISIFTRLALMVSEMIFIIISWIWHSFNNKLISKAEKFIKKYLHEVFLFILVAIYTHYFTLASFLRFDNFYTGKFDLGNMAQTVWNTANGNFFAFTNPDGMEVISRLSFHADFMLILLTPLYWIWSSPKVLLLVQSVILGLGAFFVYGISNHVLKSRNISFIFAFVYLINPLIQHVNLYDFHAVSLSTTFLLAAFYYILKARLWLFLLFATLAALTKEQVWLISGFLGIYVFIKSFNKDYFLNTKKVKIISSLYIILCLFIFYYLIWHAIPNALGSNHFALKYFSSLGGSPGEIFKNIFISPVSTLSAIFQEKQVTYIANILSPIGFLSLFALPFLIFALPSLGINLLSSNLQLSDIYYQYTSTITPFLFISAIYGFKYLSKGINKKILAVYLISISIYTAYLIGPLPFTKHPNTAMFVNQLENKEVVSKFLDKVPSNLSISATNNLGAYLANRKLLYVVPMGTESADMVIFLLNDSYAMPSLYAQKEMAKDLERSSSYKLLIKDGDFVAFEKQSIDK